MWDADLLTLSCAMSYCKKLNEDLEINQEISAALISPDLSRMGLLKEIERGRSIFSRCDGERRDCCGRRRIKGLTFEEG